MDVLALRRDADADRARWAVLAVIVLIAATAYGGHRALGLMDAPAESASTLELGGAQVQLLSAEEVVGVAASDLMSGMGHNISGWVAEDQMMVQVWLRVSTDDQAAGYDSAQLRAYRRGSPNPLRPVSGTLGNGVLAAHAVVEGSVSFVVPRDWTHLTLGATGSDRSIDIPALPAAPGSSGTPAPGGEDHSHH